MSATKYTYSIATDFPNGLVSSGRLTLEVSTSTIVVVLDHISTSGDDCDIWFRDALSVGDETVLDGLVAAHNGQPLPEATQLVRLDVPRTADGRQIIAAEKPDHKRANFYSHDWTDKTTWYEQAIRVVDEVATDAGAHTVYTLAHGYVIDNYHGKLSQEDFLKDAQGNSFRVIVKVDGVTKTERDPHFGSSGDYVIDYVAGSITFGSAQSPSAVVAVTYHYATGSRFTIAAKPGKLLKVDIVEVQFSEDIELTDTARFQAFGYVDVFAPQLLQSNGGPYPSGTKIPLDDAFVYKSITDYQNDAFRAYPKYPAMSASTGWRGAPVGVMVFDWDYQSVIPLNGDAGMEIRTWLEHDTPYGGFYATATFYCQEQDL